MPSDWKDSSIDNVRIGDNSLSLEVIQEADHREYSIKQTLSDWSIIVDVKNSGKVVVNNKEIEPGKISENRIVLNGRENKVLIY